MNHFKFLSRASLLFVICMLILTPMSFALSLEDLKYTQEIVSSATLTGGSFSRLTPFSSSTPLLGSPPISYAVDTAGDVATVSGIATAVIAIGISIGHLLTYATGLISLPAWIGTAALIALAVVGVVAIVSGIITLINGSQETGVQSAGVNLVSGPKNNKALNHNPYYVTTNLDCTGCDGKSLVFLQITLPKDIYLIGINASGKNLPVTAQLSGNDIAWQAAYAFSGDENINFTFFPNYENMTQMKSVNHVFKAGKDLDSLADSLSLTIKIYPDNPDYNQDLCTPEKGLMWATDGVGMCCGDDSGENSSILEADCGRISGKYICRKKSDGTWEWVKATKTDGAKGSKGYIMDTNCGNYQVLSTGSKWVACLPSVAMDDHCLVSLSDTTNAHAGKCGDYPYNLICTPPKGYNLSCSVDKGSCPTGKTRIMSLSNVTNAHVQIDNTESENYTYKVCCSATDPSGQKILGVATYTKHLIQVSGTSNAHAEEIGGDGEYESFAEFKSTDPKINDFDCKLEEVTVPPYEIDLDKRDEFTSNPFNNAGGLNHDYLCYIDGGEASISECAGSDSPINDEYSVGSNSSRAVFTGYPHTYYCTSDRVWSDDADLSQYGCSNLGNTWIGNGSSVGQGYCCGDDADEFFNYNIEGMTLPGNNLGYACWNSTGIPNNNYAKNATENMTSVINVNGTFYGCNIPSEDAILQQKDTVTNTSLVPTQRNGAICNMTGEFYCNYAARNDGLTWHNTSEWKIIGERALSDWGNNTNTSSYKLGLNIVDNAAYTNKSLGGCCPQDYCWNQREEKCISGNPSEVTQDSIVDDHVCWDGAWLPKSEKIKNDWDGDSGFCEDTKCLSKNLQPGLSLCLDNGTYIEDHLCENGTWVTRTALIANMLLNYTQPGDSYVLYCDSYDNVFPYTLDTYTEDLEFGETSYLNGGELCASDELYLYINETDKKISPIWTQQSPANDKSGYRGLKQGVKCVNNACVIRIKNGGNEKVYFGFSYNNYEVAKLAGLSNFDINKYLFDVNGKYSTTAPNIIIYDLGKGEQGTFWDTILGFVNWIYSMFTGLGAAHPGIKFSNQTQRIYYYNTTGKAIYAFIDDPNFTNGNIQMAINYNGYDSNIEKIKTSIGANALYNENGNDKWIYIHNKATVNTYWKDLTAKTRPE